MRPHQEAGNSAVTENQTRNRCVLSDDEMFACFAAGILLMMMMMVMMMMVMGMMLVMMKSEQNREKSSYK